MTKRLFWMGMHKVLKPTELKRLRGLGYEVFNPAYISPVYDQSADTRIDVDQPTTLPVDVFEKLLGYDFFYRPISQEIGDLLNAYFDAVVVTISPDWLTEIAKVYKGQLIFRAYGQHFSLSERLISIDAWDDIISRDLFSFVPFAAESVSHEHRWLRDRVHAIVPYQIPDDVFDHTDTWDQEQTSFEIATSFPNIQNPYFNHAYAEFSARFPQSFFRIYGPQRNAPADRRIVGALERGELFRRFKRSRGFYYDYRTSVCYLPPIEMMEIGGPVICARGSLLSEFLDAGSPNVAEDKEDALEKMARLLARDKVFARELIAAQEETRRRYDRNVVAPIFDEAFRSLIDGDSKPPAAKFDGPTLRSATVPKLTDPMVAIPLHFDGLFQYEGGKAYAFEGIPRVVDAIVGTISAQSQAGCVLSCTKASLPVMYDFFADPIATGKVELYIVDQEEPACVYHGLTNRLKLVEFLDRDARVTTVLVPHYYLFPEFLLTQKRLAIYLPDYFPFLFPGVVFDVSAEKDEENKRVGVGLAERAAAILTNSNYTRGYLPKAGFVEEDSIDKVIVAPLPFLGKDRAVELEAAELDAVIGAVGRRPFIFYPTANRPNKRLDLLMQIYARLQRQMPTLGLVLTCDLASYAPVNDIVSRLGLRDKITLLPRSSEGVLRWLYRNASLLCLTSVMEGNFPPQVLEALSYGTPVVATRLPTITELLGDDERDLLLCEPLDLEDFLAKIEFAFDNAAEVLERQRRIVSLLSKWNSPKAFSDSLGRALPEMLPAPEVA